jgi:glycerol-3-phosphate dehydrogenase
VPLAGGDFAVGDVARLIRELKLRYPFLSDYTTRRMIRAYGTEAANILDDASTYADLGQEFGAGLSEAELRWMIAREFARTGEDVLWRRSKLGLRLTPDQAAEVDRWMTSAAQA